MTRRTGQGRRRRRAEVSLRRGDAARDQRRELQHLKALRNERGAEREGAKDGRQASPMGEMSATGIQRIAASLNARMTPSVGGR